MFEIIKLEKISMTLFAFDCVSTLSKLTSGDQINPSLLEAAVKEIEALLIAKKSACVVSPNDLRILRDSGNISRFLLLSHAQ